MEGFKKYKIDYSGGALHVENIKWNEEGLVVELETEKNHEKIKLIFEDTVYLYINTSESYKPEFWIEKRRTIIRFCTRKTRKKFASSKKKRRILKTKK